MRLSASLLARAAGACLFLLAAAAPAADQAAGPRVLDAGEFVHDRSQAEWSQAYLQWVASFPRGGSPVSDTSGAQCAARQDGPVWFLATSDGTAPVTRACTIPAGRMLFVPVASMLERSGNREPDCGAMARVAADNLARHVSRTALAIDGQAVDDLDAHRLPTRECFALGMRQVPPVAARTAVADGWYVMLAPLPAGSHTIAIESRFDGTTVSTTYRLEVR